jgi:hypothetical protein
VTPSLSPGDLWQVPPRKGLSAMMEAKTSQSDDIAAP